MTNFNWIISAMECKKHEQELNNVIILIHWRYNATREIEGKSYFAETYEATILPTPSSENFIPYEQLTKQQVISWLETLIDVPTMQLSLEADIELQINPLDIVISLPFEN